MRELDRLIDINTNRACEGLRILEDGVRYRRDLAAWLDAIKGWRSTLRRFRTEALQDRLDFRRALEDPGPEATLRQLAREDLVARDPFRVNAGRVQEALRALEEYYRLLRPAWVPSIESFRFSAYELERAWTEGSRKVRRLALLDTDLYGITASDFARGRSNVELAQAMLEAGIRILQYREKSLGDRAMIEECLRIRRLTEEAGALFIVNDRVDLALAADADGVHAGQEDLPPDLVRKLIGPERILGISTHAPGQAEAAVAAGADYIGVGPLYATRTKRDVCAPVGLAYLDHAVRNVPIPFVAIGGIKRHNLEAVKARGASLVALVTEITEADDIGARVKEIRAILQRSRDHVPDTASGRPLR